MPQKNSIKQYLQNGYYHIYNRGVEKRLIFLSELDYNVFLAYLKEYLLPVDRERLTDQLANPQIPWSEKEKILKLLKLKNFFGEVNLLAYCLMPNHFHLLIKQKSADSVNKFMQALATRYTMYFNKHHSRVGSLFQGVYDVLPALKSGGFPPKRGRHIRIQFIRELKARGFLGFCYKAVLVDSDEQLIHLSRYIHKQALKGETLQSELFDLILSNQSLKNAFLTFTHKVPRSYRTSYELLASKVE